MSDTILPPRIKFHEIKRTGMQIEDLHNYAYIQKAASQCGKIDGTIDIFQFQGDKYVPKAFVLNINKPVGMVQWNKSFGKQFSGPDDDPGEVMGTPIGTGCLIGPDLFITARHCFLAGVNGTVTPQKNHVDLSPEEIAPLTNVVFNFQKSSATYPTIDSLAFPVIALVEKGVWLDYAIVRLGPRNGKKPGDLLGFLKTVPLTYVNRLDTLCIIQHPDGDPKRVQCGPLFHFNDSLLFYNNIDTYGGSSGAPVINYSSGLLEGIHFDGNCYMQTGSNKAVKIQAIKKVSMILRN
jgi:V8-like Glu-specific endopeptidase